MRVRFTEEFYIGPRNVEGTEADVWPTKGEDYIRRGVAVEVLEDGKTRRRRGRPKTARKKTARKKSGRKSRKASPEKAGASNRPGSGHDVPADFYLRGDSRPEG